LDIASTWLVRQAEMARDKSVIHSDPEILGGTPVFVGTRVPLRNPLVPALLLAIGDARPGEIRQITAP
jgi:hypothetical protein